jgi:hypothetical protein
LILSSADEIEKQAAMLDKAMRVMMEVNIEKKMRRRVLTPSKPGLLAAHYQHAPCIYVWSVLMTWRPRLVRYGGFQSVF